jgi:hypothetical protein
MCLHIELAYRIGTYAKNLIYAYSEEVTFQGDQSNGHHIPFSGKEPLTKYEAM